MIAPDIYVMPLNKTIEGPYAPEQAIVAAAGHVFVQSEEKKRVRDEISAGTPGPWHFTYGFQSVTIQRGRP